jgi:hypothetical protein
MGRPPQQFALGRADRGAPDPTREWKGQRDTVKL